MSDVPQNEPFNAAPHFLRRLVDGAFDRASSLEPRRPSMFERQTVEIAEYAGTMQDSVAGERAVAPPIPVDDRPDPSSRGKALQVNAGVADRRMQVDHGRSVESEHRAMPPREMVGRRPHPVPVHETLDERLQGVHDIGPPPMLPAKVDPESQRTLATHDAGSPPLRARDVADAPLPEVGSLLKARVDYGSLHKDSPAPL